EQRLVDLRRLQLDVRAGQPAARGDRWHHASNAVAGRAGNPTHPRGLRAARETAPALRQADVDRGQRVGHRAETGERQQVLHGDVQRDRAEHAVQGIAQGISGSQVSSRMAVEHDLVPGGGQVTRQVVILESQLKQYRRALLGELAARLRRDDIVLKVAYSPPNQVERTKSDNVTLPPDLGVEVPG